jgi:hypothetical protein
VVSRKKKKREDMKERGEQYNFKIYHRSYYYPPAQRIKNKITTALHIILR